MKETSKLESGKLDRSSIEDRVKKLLEQQPEKKECLTGLSYQRMIELETWDKWKRHMVGKSDVPIAKMIEKMNNSDWVDQGRKYIINGNICPFCQHNTIDENLKTQLNDFFDEEYKKCVQEINNNYIEYQKESNAILDSIQELLKNALGEDEKRLIKPLGELLKSNIQANIINMQLKIEKPGQEVDIQNSQKNLDEINDIIKKINSDIKKHNNLVENYVEEKKKVISDVWLLLVQENQEMIDQYNNRINGLKKGVYALEQKKSQYVEKSRQLKDEIAEKNKKVTSVQPAVDEINRLLHNYGFNNFSICPSTEKANHYQIKRPDETLAEQTLSEGEVTFITFLYYLQWIKGSQNEQDVTQDRIIVIDDPISSLDSNVLFVVSTLLKDVINKVLTNDTNIKQVFVLTHNVYFHKELSFRGNGKEGNKNIHYWILRKKNEITNLQYYGQENPISSSYELLWKELKEAQKNSCMTIQNVMRRIIENYFKLLGKYSDENIIQEFDDYENQEICRSLLSWVNDGSHCIPDDLYVERSDDMLERYMAVFKAIFKYTNHIEHYNMMMGINNQEE